MKKKGFTLLEVMLATGILVVLLVGLMNLYIYCFRLQDEARDVNNVTQMMRGEMERLRAMQFGDEATPNTVVYTYELSSKNGTPYEVDMMLGVPAKNIPGIGLVGTIRVEAQWAKLAGGADSNTLLNVRVIAGWAHRHNGIMIGNGSIVAGKYIFPAGGYGTANSSFILETAIANRS